MTTEEKYADSLFNATNDKFCSFINSIWWTKEALNDLDDKISIIQSIVSDINDFVIILRKDWREDLVLELLTYTYNWWKPYGISIDLSNDHSYNSNSVFMWSYGYPINNFKLNGLIHIYVDIYGYFYWMHEIFYTTWYSNGNRTSYISDKELLNSQYIGKELKEYLQNELLKKVKTIRNKYWTWDEWKQKLFELLSK